MKYGIFENGGLRNVALTDSEKDSLMQHRTTYVAKEFTDQQASDALDYKKTFQLNGEEIISNDNELPNTQEMSQINFEQWLMWASSGVSAFLKSNKDHSDFNEWQTVYNQLLAINLREMEDLYPLSQTPQEWFSAQSGHSQKKLLQLP